MAIATEICATAYEGNDSTSTPYLVTWPFLDAEHIKVAVRVGEEGEFTYLEAADFTVLTDGDNPRVTTAVAYDDTHQVVVYRDTPRIQPTEYPTGDPFPAASHETALDRVTMIAQETARDAGLNGFAIPSPGLDGEDGADGAGYGGTSTSSVAIGTGAKTFTTQSGLAYLAGSRVRLASDADPENNWMEGVVTAYAGTTIEISADIVGGSGSHADWNLSIAGLQGANGTNGTNGTNGSNGTNGISAGLAYLFNTATSGDPGTGKILLTAAPALHISETDNDANSVGAYLATWDDSTGTVKGTLRIRSVSTPTIFAIYSITGTITDSGAYDQFSLTLVSAAGTFTNDMPVRVEFYRAGDKGADGASGASIAIQSFQTLTDGSTVTWTADANVFENNAVVTLGGNRTLAMSGWTSGMKGVLRVIQDGTGSRTLTLPATSTVPDGGGGAISLSTAAGAVDLIYVICHGTNLFHFIHLPNLT